MNNIISGYGYDKFISETVESGRVIVLAGECALQRSGLTSYLSDGLQAWTDSVDYTGIHNRYIIWYFNPFARDVRDTSEGTTPNIRIPSKERALVEYIMFHYYFDEGILIEGLKNYLYEMGGDTSKLYEEADKFHLKEDLLAYWIKEAIEDEDD